MSKASSKPPSPAQEALQTTFVLKGTLKRAQLMYLRIGELLIEIRDRKLYEALKHPDMTSYARERLGLGQSSLYNYMRIYDWVKQSHPEWLKPKPEGFIPDLSDVGDLMWIESELVKINISAARRKALKELHTKGLAGQLTQSEVRKFRKQDNTQGTGLNRLLLQLRTLRHRAGRISGVSPEVLAQFDVLIQMVANENTLKVARLAPPDAVWRKQLLA